MLLKTRVLSLYEHTNPTQIFTVSFAIDSAGVNICVYLCLDAAPIPPPPPP